MTVALEQPAPVREDRVQPAMSAHERRGSWSRRRVELRLAARQSRRAWPTSLLVIALVAMPMVLVSGAATFLASRTATPEQKITAELGHAGAWLTIVGGEDPTRYQASDDPSWFDVERDAQWRPVHPELPAPADLTGLVPEGELLKVDETNVTVATPGGVGLVAAFIGDAADPRLDGRFELLDGRRPRSDAEAAVSPGALTRLEARIGDALTLTEPATTLTIVGVMKAVTQPDGRQAVFLPAAVEPSIDAEPHTLWFSPDWQPTADDLTVLNRAGIIAYARDLVAASDALASVDPATAWSLAAVTMIVGGFTAYLVILLAGAGFAVSARRQQRSLAVAASVGADRGSVFRIVLFQGTVLGLVGGVLGAALGVALAYPALRLFDDGAAESFWGFHVPWWAVIGTVLFATAVGTASALLPARAATRGDVLSSLRGSRRPARIRADRPFWGSLLIVVGLTSTVAGGVTLAGLNAAERIDYENPLRMLCVAGIVAGPVLFQIGAILAGHWLLTLIARGLSPLGLGPRIAARDAAASPARIVPAFAAIAACVFLASFGMTTASVYLEYTARAWWYGAPPGSTAVWLWGEDEDGRLQALAVEALEATEPEAIGAVLFETFDATAYVEEGAGERVTAEVVDYVDCAAIEAGPCVTRADALFGRGFPAVVAPGELGTVLGAEIPSSVQEAFAEGGAVVIDAAHLDGDAIVLHRWDAAGTDRFWENWAPSKPLPEPLETVRIPAQHVQPPQQRLPWSVILSPAAAERFGIETEVRQLIASYAEPPSQQALDRLALAAGQEWNSGGFSYRFESGPPSPEAWLWLILGAAGVLVLGAGGVALGLARVERRPDDATLAAVGASPGIRRRVAAWQALIIVGTGSVTGSLAGIIPAWGIVMQTNVTDDLKPTMADTPWSWLLLLAFGLPLAIAIVSALVPARRPDLTRRTAIA